MNITEKVAFIKGLASRLNPDEKSIEGKILDAIIDVLDDIAITVTDLDDDYDNLCKQIDAIDDDLYSLEEEFHHESDDTSEDEFFYEVTCPACNETICLSEDVLLDGQISCPNCNEELEFDFDELSCDCDEKVCSAGCNHE